MLKEIETAQVKIAQKYSHIVGTKRLLEIAKQVSGGRDQSGSVASSTDSVTVESTRFRSAMHSTSKICAEDY